MPLPACAKVASIGGRSFAWISQMEGNMKTKEQLSQLALWRISLAGLCLLGTLVADSLSDWSAPVNLGATINTVSNEQ